MSKFTSTSVWLKITFNFAVDDTNFQMFEKNSIYRSIQLNERLKCQCNGQKQNTSLICDSLVCVWDCTTFQYIHIAIALTDRHYAYRFYCRSSIKLIKCKQLLIILLLFMFIHFCHIVELWHWIWAITPGLVLSTKEKHAHTQPYTHKRTLRHG